MPSGGSSPNQTPTYHFTLLGLVAMALLVVFLSAKEATYTVVVWVLVILIVVTMLVNYKAFTTMFVAKS